MILGDILIQNVLRFPHKTGIVDETSKFTWKEANDRANALANALISLGLNKGDRVAVLSDNCCQYMVILFGLAKAGLVYIALNHRLPADQQEFYIQDVKAKALFIQDKFNDILDINSPGMNSVDLFIGIGQDHGLEHDYDQLLSDNATTEPLVEIEPDDLYAIYFTSGTTGDPKGAPRTHRQQLMNSVIDLMTGRNTPNDTGLISLPMFTAGSVFRLWGHALSGMKIVTHNFSGKSWAEIVERERPTITSIVPIRYHMIRDYLSSAGRHYDISSLQKVFTGGGMKFRPEVFQEMLSFFDIDHSGLAYGSTETCGTITFLDAEEIRAGLRPGAGDKERRRLDSIGLPVLDAKVMLVDEDGREVQPGQTGEILLKGDTVTKGYWNRPELNRKAFKQGWFFTGDFAHMDEDGYLYFDGRKGLTIKTGGFFVNPKTVEEGILKHPTVAETAVFGIPDPKWIEAIKAVVILKRGEKASEDEIRDHCRKFLAGFQVPKSVDFMNAEDVPKDGQGKIAVGRLRASYWNKED